MTEEQAIVNGSIAGMLINPCVTQFGPGPTGWMCSDCVHLHRHYRMFRCEWRPGFHRKQWATCAKFKPIPRIVYSIPMDLYAPPAPGQKECTIEEVCLPAVRVSRR
jgi:hypothetical protein